MNTPNLSESLNLLAFDNFLLLGAWFFGVLFVFTVLAAIVTD